MLGLGFGNLNTSMVNLLQTTRQVSKSGMQVAILKQALIELMRAHTALGKQFNNLIPHVVKPKLLPETSEIPS